MQNDIPKSLRLLAAPATLVAVGLFLVPVVIMLSLAFRDPQPGLDNLEWLAVTPAVHKIVGITIRFSLLSALAAVVIGYLLAYVIWLAEKTTSITLLGVVMVSFWLSVLIRCFALIMLFGNNGPINGGLRALSFPAIQLMRNEAGVFIGMVHYLVPFAVLTILAALQSIDLAIVAAARTMGASRGHIFRAVVLPLSLPGLVSAVALCIVIALGFYITPALLGGGRVVMLAEFITFHVQNILAWGKASSLAIFLLAGIGVAFGLTKLLEQAVRRQRIRA